MRFLVHIAISLLLAALAVPAFAGEVIDGVIATVNRRPIFQSDWDEAVHFEAFMEQKPLDRVEYSDRAKALQRLIDRALLEEQMKSESAYLQPTEQEVASDLAKVRAQIPQAKEDAAWLSLLARYGLSEEIVKRHLKDEVEVMNFVEVRLRPTVHIDPEEIEAYYTHTLVPDLRSTGSPILPLSEVQPRIHELLTQQRMDELLDAWLHNLRQQAEIESSVPLPSTTTFGPSAGSANSGGQATISGAD